MSAIVLGPTLPRNLRAWRFEPEFRGNSQSLSLRHSLEDVLVDRARQPCADVTWTQLAVCSSRDTKPVH
eukprot:12434485-Alexandrium_andersonii.AAC.1